MSRNSRGGGRESFLAGLLGITSVLCLLAACSSHPTASNSQPPVLEGMSVTWGADLKFEKNFLDEFGKRNEIKTQYVPNSRLGVYKQLLAEKSKEPDLLEIDVIWPPMLANDLVDLTPYLKEPDRKAFVPQLLADYTVSGRLVALPVYVDMGVLYYRPDLLAKYGYHHAPQTWDELEKMAARIQQGERQAGDKDFWGYVWQGSTGEPGTCNALEIQSSWGGGNFIEPGGSINVRNRLFAQGLRRATGWIGTISPRAEYVYREDDSMNLWYAGQTAFMRNWASGFSQIANQQGKDSVPFDVAPLPAGPGGHRGTLGGMGIAVSKYAANRALAIKAVMELTSQSKDLERTQLTGGIPTHTALLNRPDVMSQNTLLAAAKQLIDSTVARPSLETGDQYDEVSQAYAKAVNSVFRRQATPEAAMAELETKLVKITGRPTQEPVQQKPALHF